MSSYAAPLKDMRFVLHDHDMFFRSHETNGYTASGWLRASCSSLITRNSMARGAMRL